jgi:hypothetical protein
LLPNGLDPYACVIETKLNLVTRCDPQTVAHRFRNHHLPLGANTGAHTSEYNFLRTSSTALANGMQGVWLSWSDRDQAAAGMTPPA